MILEKINKISKEVGVNASIAKVILNQIGKHGRFDSTIVELATLSGCSQPTVTRFVSLTGIDKFKVLVNKINEEAKEYFPEKAPSPDKLSIETNSLLMDIKTTLDALDEKLVDQLAEKIVRAKKINITGMGGNITVKSEIEHKLSQIGKHVMTGIDWHQQLINIHYMTKDDLMIIVSYSGDKYETLKIAEAAKEKKIPILAITGDFDSQLRKKADYELIIYSKDPKYRSFSITGKVCALAIWDVLFKRILSYDIVTPDVVEAWRWEN